MKHIWKYLSLICYELFAAALVCSLIKGITGLIAGGVFLLIVSVMMGVGRLENSDVKCPLLLDLMIMAVNFGLIANINYWPFTVSLGLGAAFDIINRIVYKTYNTESIAAFIKTEFRFPADLELVSLLLFGFVVYEHDMYRNPVVWVIIAIILIDFIRQKLEKRHLAK